MPQENSKRGEKPELGSAFAASARFATGSHVRQLVVPVCDTIKLWICRSRRRRELAQFSMAQIKDIGATRVDVLNEAGKPFWRP